MTGTVQQAQAVTLHILENNITGELCSCNHICMKSFSKQDMITLRIIEMLWLHKGMMSFGHSTTSWTVILTKICSSTHPKTRSIRKTPHYSGFQPNKERMALFRNHARAHLPKYPGTSNISKWLYIKSQDDAELIHFLRFINGSC